MRLRRQVYSAVHHHHHHYHVTIATIAHTDQTVTR